MKKLITDKFELHLQDAIQGLSALPENSFDLAICDPEYKTLAERLFRKAYLADSFKQAADLQPLLQAGESLVTPEGDLFRPNGTMPTSKEPQNQLIYRKREMKDLRKLNEQRTEHIHSGRNKLT